MLIGRDGFTVGSLSGGCLEEEVARHAQEVIETGDAKLLPFDMRRRFGCNGDIEIFIERLDEHFLDQVAEHFEARRSCVAITNFGNSAQKMGSRIVKTEEEIVAGSLQHRIDPSIQLMVIGGGHDSIPFRPLCKLLGWDLFGAETVADLSREPDAWTAMVVKTHNYGRDFAALQKFVPMGLRYLGLIGPRRRRDQLLADLFDVTGPIDAELFAPAGLDLGAETPEEIALAIVAEIQSVFAAASVESLRNRKAPIHAISYNFPETARATR